MKILISSFKQSIKSCPFVLKEINKYFGFYFIGCSIGVFLILNYVLPAPGSGSVSSSFFMKGSMDSSSMAILWTSAGLLLLSKVFTVFMIPYYAYKKSQGPVPPFWIFIKEAVWPVAINHIKALFVILCFCLLIIIPGIYKMIRYTFLTETVLFDSLYRREGRSALKMADKTTRGYFMPIVLFIFLSLCLKIAEGLSAGLLFFLPLFIKSSLVLIVGFYVSCFMILFKCQFYFELKKQRKEEISC